MKAMGKQKKKGEKNSILTCVKRFEDLILLQGRLWTFQAVEAWIEVMASDDSAAEWPNITTRKKTSQPG